MRRLISTALALTLGAGLMAACTKEDKADDELRAALQRTAKLSRAFTYEETVLGGETTVIKGIVEDDYRYKVRVGVDGTDVYEEVASDDKLAVRSLAPESLNRFLSPFVRDALAQGGGVVPAALTQDPDSEITKGVNTLKSLQRRAWVLDPTGAPSLAPSGRQKRLLGEDVVYDALTVFRLSENLISEAFQVDLFNEESIDYRAKEDPFPTPKRSSGIKRYDYERFNLPNKEAASAVGTQQAVPGARNFRKMSVYVKDGRVIEIRELIDVQSRLEDLAKLYDIKVPKGTSDDEFAIIVTDAINTILKGRGDDPLRVRSLKVTFADLGKDVTVALPTETVPGELSVLRNRGRAAAVANQPGAPAPADGEGGAEGSDGSTTSTTAGAGTAAGSSG